MKSVSEYLNRSFVFYDKILKKQFTKKWELMNENLGFALQILNRGLSASPTFRWYIRLFTCFWFLFIFYFFKLYTGTVDNVWKFYLLYLGIAR
jgi:hypothetical protein